MKPLPKLLDANGRPFVLERELASGGEGSVYTLPNDVQRVAKVYHKPPTAETIQKLTVMSGLANAKTVGHRGMAQFPVEGCQDSQGRGVCHAPARGL